MAISFSEDLHPKKIPNTKLKFGYYYRDIQYLQYFGVINLKENIFTPSNLKFDSYEKLKQFLYERGIIGNEANVNAFTNEIDGWVLPFVDTGKIYNEDLDLNNRILQYKLYSINEIAHMLSLSRPTVYKLIDSGELKAKRVNGQLRIMHKDYIDYING